MTCTQQRKPVRAGEGIGALAHRYSSNGAATLLGTQNVIGMSSTMLEAVFETTRVAILKHGHDTASKLQAGAPDAGHVIVATLAPIMSRGLQK
jgi:hypothetical protein